MASEWSNSAESYAKAFVKATSHFSQVGAMLMYEDIINKYPSIESDLKISFVDVAAGPGTFIIELLKVLPRNYCQISNYTVTDFSPAMVEMAQKLLSSHPDSALSSFKYLPMNAQELTFADASYDYLSCMFGIMFVPDRSIAMHEMQRVCKPGGIAILSSWNSSDVFVFTTELAQYVGSLLPGEKSATTMIFEVCSDPEMFKSELIQAGFQSAESKLEDYLFSFHPDHEGMYHAFMQNPGLIQALKGKEVSYEVWKEFCLSDITAKYRQEDGSLSFRMRGCIVKATK